MSAVVGVKGARGWNFGKMRRENSCSGRGVQLSETCPWQPDRSKTLQRTHKPSMLLANRLMLCVPECLCLILTCRSLLEKPSSCIKLYWWGSWKKVGVLSGETGARSTAAPIHPSRSQPTLGFGFTVSLEPEEWGRGQQL
jgi:hypothetical protein